VRPVCRQLAALGLILTVFLPTLVVTASAHVPIDTSSENDHFLLYHDENGDTVCRKATELEARELDKIKPTDLRPINHLDLMSDLKGGLKAQALPQHLTIVLRASANLQANGPALAAFNRAAQAWESLITSPVTIFIDADVGPDNFGTPWESGVLGATSSPSFTVDYTRVRSTLNTVNTAGTQAVYSALPQSSLPIDVGSGSANAVSISNSIARAIGLADPTSQPANAAARIGFNSAVNYDYDSSDGVIGRDFQSVATHEIGHALGFTSRSGSGSSTPAMWDLYRFRSGTTSGSFTNAQRIMTAGGATLNSQYYFVPGITEIGLSDGGPSAVTTNNADGNQSSHWRQAVLNSSGYIGIMDPRLPANITRPITSADTGALNIFGYNSNLIVTGPPANDNFANAQVLNGCSGSVNSTNVSATSEGGEINHLSETGDPNGGGSRSIWYQWQAPSSGNVTFDTSGSEIDTVMGVYTGNAVNSLAVVAQDDDVVNGTIRTSSITFNANAGSTYKIAVDGYNSGGAGGEIGPVKLNWNASNCIPSLVQMGAFFAVNESAGSVTILITRSGDSAGPATVNYATSDSAGLASCSANSGVASERCDYATSVGTARFTAGQSVATFTIPIVNDTLVEGDENFTVTLSSPSGVALGSPPTSTVTIIDNDSAPPSPTPIDGIPFFVTQQYIDFLGRLPDSTGFANWVGTLNGCPNGGFGEFDNPGCDRVHVSAGFFLSPEFQGRGYFAYRFYEVALDRRPAYAEFVPDMALVGGPQSPESEVLSKATYTEAWTQRPEFKSRYDSLSNSAYVNALEANAEVAVSNKQALIDALNGGQMNRGQVLRNIVESQPVSDRFFIRAFVAMQYFGYLRRDPDAVGFQNWVNTLNADPSNFRHMIFGFLFSTEYRQRFGP
jgi:Calx-beta domain